MYLSCALQTPAFAFHCSTNNCFLWTCGMFDKGICIKTGGQHCLPVLGYLLNFVGHVCVKGSLLASCVAAGGAVAFRAACVVLAGPMWMSLQLTRSDLIQSFQQNVGKLNMVTVKKRAKSLTVQLLLRHYEWTPLFSCFMMFMPP